MNKKRRFLGKLIADLQNNSTAVQNNTLTLAQEPRLQKKRLIAVPMYYNIQPLYEFFLIGEINIELQLDSEDEYFPIGIKQSPLNKWRPFVKAEQFHNRIEMTIDASYQGISEFEFLIQKLQCCSNDIFKQLALYLQGYQQFIRRIKEKMQQNPVPPRLYEYKFQNFLKKATEYIDNLPIDGLYAVSILQLDYSIYNTKRIKFIVSKALIEIVGGVDQAEAAQILLRKGWLEVFGGSQRIMKNIMLLNRLMKEGRQLLTFKIYTVDKILIQVQAEIEIVQSLRTFVDVGFVEIIKFNISPETMSYLYEMRTSNIQLKSLPYELYFNNKTFDPLPPQTSLTYSAYNKENPIAKQLINNNEDNFAEEGVQDDQELFQENYDQKNFGYRPNVNENTYQNNEAVPNYNRNQSMSGQYSHRSSMDEEGEQRSSFMPIKKEEEDTNFAGKGSQRANSTIGAKGGRRSRSNSNSSNYSNQEIHGVMPIKELEQHADQLTHEEIRRQSQASIKVENGATNSAQNRHPNYDQHQLDEKYSQKSQAFMEKFYSDQEIQKLKLAQATAPKKQLFPSVQSSGGDSTQTEIKNDQSSRADSFDMRSNTSSISDNAGLNILSSPEQNTYQQEQVLKAQQQQQFLKTQQQKATVFNQYPLSQLNNTMSLPQNQDCQYNQNQYPTSQSFQIQEKYEPTKDLFNFSSTKKSQVSAEIYNSNEQYKDEDQDNHNGAAPNEEQIVYEVSYQPQRWPSHQSQQQHLLENINPPQLPNQVTKEQLEYQPDYPINISSLKKEGSLYMNNYNSLPNFFNNNSSEMIMSKSNQNLIEYELKQDKQEIEKEDVEQENFKEELNDNFDINQHEYFNIFEDESLGCTFQELQEQQKKLHKMIYRQYY